MDPELSKLLNEIDPILKDVTIELGSTKNGLLIGMAITHVIKAMGEQTTNREIMEGLALVAGFKISMLSLPGQAVAMNELGSDAIRVAGAFNRFREALAKARET
jgi:hypothetical protein